MAAGLNGDPQTALRLVERLLRDQPDNPDYLLAKSQHCGALGRYAEQAAAAERFLLVSPHPGEACPALGQAYSGAGQPQKALDAHRRCLDFKPGDPEALFQYAFTLEEAGRLAEAEAFYVRVMRTSPHYLGAPISIARLRLKQGRAPEAAAVAAQVLRIAPRNTAAMLMAAMAAAQQGDMVGARRLIDSALAISPGHPDLLALRKRLQP